MNRRVDYKIHGKRAVKHSVGGALKVGLSIEHYVKVVEESLYLVAVGAAVAVLFAVFFTVISWDKVAAVIREVVRDIEAMWRFAEAL
ncbi:hypothetical protein Pogu_1311 [Pyrobaculum oguniense TE7]|uniref:Uncharacterized protein n=1 Tax=Pyrobaculum oguniense (strain DSM 13380 / JCM 10595 / TE7) TaxID=698757 RepID=H6QAD7_PYROT|nr:hypothetical protein Pogu_1311 [Pyrobaculum oguniense TE7]